MSNSVIFTLLIFTINFAYVEGKQSFRLTFNMELSTKSNAKIESTIGVPLNEFTICYWARVHNLTSRTIFSYAVPKRFDEIWTGIDVPKSGKSSVFLHRQNNENQTLDESGISSQVEVSKGEWVDVCVAWSKFSGAWKINAKGKEVGKGHGLAEDYPVVAGGIAMLGQDQDGYGGIFQSEDAFRGDISEFHMWDYLLFPSEISQFHSCTLENEGNVISWSKAIFKLQNGVEFAPIRLPCGSST